MDRQQEQLVSFLNKYFPYFGVCISIDPAAPSMAFRDLIVHDITRSIFRELIWQYLAVSKQREDGTFCTYDQQAEYELGKFKPDPAFVFALFKEYLLPIDFFEDTPRMQLGRDSNLKVIFNLLCQVKNTPVSSANNDECVSAWNACLLAAEGKDVTDEIEAKAVLKMYSSQKEKDEKTPPPRTYFVTGKQLELALRLYKRKLTIWTEQPHIRPHTTGKKSDCYTKMVFYSDGKFPSIHHHRHVQYSSEYEVTNTRQFYEMFWRKPEQMDILRCLYKHRYKKELGTPMFSSEKRVDGRSFRKKTGSGSSEGARPEFGGESLAYLLNRVTAPPRASLEQQQQQQQPETASTRKKSCLEELRERGFRSTVRKGNTVAVMKAAVGHVRGYVLGKKKKRVKRAGIGRNRNNSTFVKHSHKFLGAVGNVYKRAPNAGRSLNININFSGSLTNFICGSTRIANAFLQGRKVIIHRPIYISNIASINQSKLAVLRDNGKTTSSQATLKMLKFPAFENFYSQGHSIEFPSNVNIYKHKGQNLKQVIDNMNKNFDTNPLIDRTLMRWKAELDEARQEISEKDVNVLLLIARLVMGVKTDEPVQFLTSRCLLSRCLVAGSVSMNQSSYNWRKGTMKNTKAENRKQKGALIQCPGLNILEQRLRANGYKSLGDKLVHKALELLRLREAYTC